MSFFSELKRRSVFKVGAAYVVLAWLLLQVAAIVLPAFAAPLWVMQAFLFFLLLGFLLTLVLAWLYELTPEGLRLTSAVENDTSLRPQTGQKLNYIIICSLALLLVAVIIDQYVLEGARSPAVDAAAPGNLAPTLAATATITDKSIAVLPLDDFNAGGDEAWIADGLTEEILNALTRTPDLLVASRTSSFQYKDQAVSVQEVATALGVAHILEGSVRRSADRLRVTVQLIRAADGFHLWSENYDRTPDDIITVQEDIAFQIATALQTAMDPAALREMVQAGTNSVAAYNAYLKGLALSNEVGGITARETYAAFELARELDPDFSLAHDRAAQYWNSQLQPILVRSAISTTEAITPQEMLVLYEERIQRAIDTAKGAERFVFQMQQARVNLHFRAAYRYAQQYMEVDPALQQFDPDVGGNMDIMIQVIRTVGEPELGLEILQRLTQASTLDGAAATAFSYYYYYLGALEQGRDFVLSALARFPFDESVKYQAQRLLIAGGYIEEARQVMDQVTGTQLAEDSMQLMRLRQACAEADIDTANQLVAEISNNGTGDVFGIHWQVLHLMSRTEEAAEQLRVLDQEGLLYSLSSFLVYPYFDINQYPNLKAALQRDGVPLPVYQPIPYACPAPAQ